MRTLRYEVVDVFTDRAYAGNPLAVVLDADDLPTEALQAIAGEFNLSETAFPMAADAEGADYRLRIFTPATELPFAGHPSVGAAWVMARRGRVAPGRVVQSCGAGLLPLQVAAGGGPVTLAGGPPSYAGEVDAAPLLAAVGLASDDVVAPPGRAGCGIDFTYLLVRDEAVARARPDQAALRRLDLGTGLSVTSFEAGSAHSRVFVPEVGVPEDPATGSAAVGLGVYLAALGAVTGSAGYVVRQGLEMGRPSTLRCTVTVEDGRAVATTVAGDVVPVARGEIRRPD